MTKLTNDGADLDPQTSPNDMTATTIPGMASHLRSNPGDNNNDIIMGTPSDYVLIAMIIAMMFCMTLCCLCLFCRSSNRLSICGVNFEFNERRTSVENIENQSEIHEVVPLTPTTMGDYNNRLPDIESMLRGDAPPPLYNEIVKKTEASDTGILASFRAKSSMMRGRASDSAIQCPTVEEGVCQKAGHLPPMVEESTTHSDNTTQVTVETVDEVTKQLKDHKEVFVYDINDLNRDEDDDVFM